MNRIFKSIWNIKTGTWVAASELGKSKGKKSSSAAALAVGFLVALCFPAHASNFDTNGTGLGFGGDGFWNTTDTNWSNSNGTTPTYSWFNGDSAQFQNSSAINVINNDPNSLNVYSFEFYGQNVNINGGAFNAAYGQFYVQNPNTEVNISSDMSAQNYIYNYGSGILNLSGKVDAPVVYSGGNGTLKLTGGSNTAATLYTFSGSKTETGTATENYGSFRVDSNSLLTLGGTLVSTSNSNSYVYGTIDGVGDLVKKGQSTLFLLGDATHTGGTTIEGVNGQGGITIGNGNNSGSLSGNVTMAGGQLTFNRADAIDFGGSIVGIGQIIQAGPGSTTLYSALELDTNFNDTLGSTVVQNRGDLSISRAYLVTRGENAHAILLSPNVSNENMTLNVNDATIQTVGKFSKGISISSIFGGTTSVDIKNNYIVTYAEGSTGIEYTSYGENNSIVNISDTTITTDSSNAGGLRFTTSGQNSNNTIQLTNVNVRASGLNAPALSISSSNDLNSSITTTVTNGTYEAPGSIGFQVIGKNSTLFVDNAMIGSGTDAVAILNGANAEISNSNIFTGSTDLNHAALLVHGDALDATSPSRVLLDKTQVTTVGNQTSGIKALSNSTATLNTVTVDTGGISSFGLIADNEGNNIGQAPTINVATSSINTQGQFAYGAVALNGGVINFNGGDIINTKGDSAFGIIANSGGTVTAKNTNITTTGAQAVGVLLTNYNDVGTNPETAVNVSLDNVKITTSNTHANGIVLSSGLNSGVKLTANNVDITTSGESAYGILANNPSSTVTMTGLNNKIATSGDNAHAVYANDSAVVQMTGAVVGVQTNGISTFALKAENGAKINLDNTTLVNNGSRELGAFATSNGVVSLENGSSGLTQTYANDGGRVIFGQDTVLDNATLVSAQNGTTVFKGNANPGANTKVSLQNGGLLDLSASTNTRLTIGSVSGTGDISMGEQTLYIGAANQNDAIDGKITPLNIASLGGLHKEGTGSLTLNGTNTYLGDTTVAQGALVAGSSGSLSSLSTHKVLAAGTLELAGTNQTLSKLENAGVVSLVGSAPGSTLTITDSYVGNNGLLRLGTTLADNNSVTDKLVLNGPTATASGNTRISIVNQSGLGALTTGDGIEVVAARNGATTTAQTTKDAFSLAGGMVAAGAYEYRLKPGATNESWYLSSTTPVVGPPVVVPPVVNPPVVPPVVPPEVPTTPETPVVPVTPPVTPPVVEVPTFRSEVPVIAALSSQVHQSNIMMLGSLQARSGGRGLNRAPNTTTTAQINSENVEVQLASATSAPSRQAWGRVISADIDLKQGGAVSPNSSGSVSGFQAGTDIWVAPSGDWKGGIYVGQLNGKVRVNGFSSGIANNYSGDTDLKSQFFGGYATYQNTDGLYVDNVLQYSRHDNTIEAASGFSAKSKSTSILASVEVGKAFPLNSNWSIEPQAQLIYEKTSFDDIQLINANVKTNSNGMLTGRLGAAIKGNISTSNGLVQPYGRLSAYKSSNSKTENQYINAVSNTTISTPNGSSFAEVAVGAVWHVKPNVSLYGEITKLNSLGGSTQTRSAAQGSIGLKVNF